MTRAIVERRSTEKSSRSHSALKQLAPPIPSSSIPLERELTSPPSTAMSLAYRLRAIKIIIPEVRTLLFRF